MQIKAKLSQIWPILQVQFVFSESQGSFVPTLDYNKVLRTELLTPERVAIRW